MAAYNAEFLRATLSATADWATIMNPASGPKRIQLLDTWLGSDSAPADNAIRLEVGRRSSAPTGGTNPTAVPSDEGDSTTCNSVVTQAPTSNGTVVSGVLLAITFNQRSTTRWFAIPGREINIAATASRGFGFATPTAGGTPQGILGANWAEL